MEKNDKNDFIMEIEKKLVYYISNIQCAEHIKMYLKLLSLK